MANDVARRIDAASSNPSAKPWGANVHDDRGAAVTGIRQERVAIAGHPLQLLPITPLDGAGVVAARAYPYDGDTATIGGLPGGAEGAVQLQQGSNGAPAFDCRGMILLIFGGTGVGQWRYVKGYDTSLRVATPHRPWDAGGPVVGSAYRLLIPTWKRNELHVAAEYESASAAGIVVARFYDLACDPPTSGDYAGQLGVDGPLRVARTFLGLELDLDNLGLQGDTRQGGFYASRSRTEPARGALGAKVVVKAMPGAGAMALAAGPT